MGKSATQSWGRPKRLGPGSREKWRGVTRSQLHKRNVELRSCCGALLAEHRASGAHLVCVPPSAARVKAEQALEAYLREESDVARRTRVGLAREGQFRLRLRDELEAELDARVEMTRRAASVDNSLGPDFPPSSDLTRKERDMLVLEEAPSSGAPGALGAALNEQAATPGHNEKQVRFADELMLTVYCPPLPSHQEIEDCVAGGRASGLLSLSLLPEGGFTFRDPPIEPGQEEAAADTRGASADQASVEPETPSRRGTPPHDSGLATSLAELFVEHSRAENARFRAVLAQEREEHLERLAAAERRQAAAERRHLELLGALLGASDGNQESTLDEGGGTDTRSSGLDARAPAYAPSEAVGPRPTVLEHTPEPELQDFYDPDEAPLLVPADEPAPCTALVIWTPDFGTCVGTCRPWWLAAADAGTRLAGPQPARYHGDRGLPSPSSIREASTRDPRPIMSIRVDYDHPQYLPWFCAAERVQRWWRSPCRGRGRAPVLPVTRAGVDATIEVLDAAGERQREAESRAARLTEMAQRRSHWQAVRVPM